MGILNVTPDSFSDGGSFTGAQKLKDQVDKMIAAGVDIIDVGGESTRPFAEAVSEREELKRVIPAIKAVRAVSTTLPISIDTTKAFVAEAAIAQGATMVNDISALRHDPAMIKVLRSCDTPVIIMHMQRTPEDMQLDPKYENVVEEICAFFKERTAWMQAQAIERHRIILDPGIGFGKTPAHNVALLRNIGEFKKLGYPVLIGHSRKSFFEKIFGLPLEQRDSPTAVVSALCAQQNVDILRVHDVAKTVTAVRLVELISQSVNP